MRKYDNNKEFQTKVTSSFDVWKNENQKHKKVYAI